MPSRARRRRHPHTTYWATWDNGMSLLRQGRNRGKLADIKIIKYLVLKQSIGFIHINCSLVLCVTCRDIKIHMQPLALFCCEIHIPADDNTVIWQHFVPL